MAEPRRQDLAFLRVALNQRARERLIAAVRAERLVIEACALALAALADGPFCTTPALLELDGPAHPTARAVWQRVRFVTVDGTWELSCHLPDKDLPL